MASKLGTLGSILDGVWDRRWPEKVHLIIVAESTWTGYRTVFLISLHWIQSDDKILYRINFQLKWGYYAVSSGWTTNFNRDTWSASSLSNPPCIPARPLGRTSTWFGCSYSISQRYTGRHLQPRLTLIAPSFNNRSKLSCKSDSSSSMLAGSLRTPKI